MVHRVYLIDQADEALEFLKLDALGHSSDLEKRSGASGFVRDWPVFSSRPEHRIAKRRLAPLFNATSARRVASSVRQSLDRIPLTAIDDFHIDVARVAATEAVREILGTRDVELPIREGNQILQLILLRGRDEITSADRRLALVACDHFIRWSVAYLEDVHSPLTTTLRELITDGVYDQYLAATMLAQLVTGSSELLANGISLAIHDRATRAAEIAQGASSFFVEDVLMRNPPVAWAMRVALADVETSEGLLVRGDRVRIAIGAASRDAAHRSAEGCPITGATRNLPFGHGVHYCLGSIVAKLVMAATLDFVVDQDCLDVDLAHVDIADGYGGVAVRSLPRRRGGRQASVRVGD